MTADEDIVHHLARAAAEVSYGMLDAAARDAAKKSLMDTLGVMLAATGLEPAISAVIEIVEEAGGESQSSLLGSTRRVPALMAAFAHGAMAHCLDYDDQTPWGQHAASSIVPAVLAVAERQAGVSGVDLIAAIAVGQDIFARLRCNVGWLKNWNLSSVMGVFAATAAAGRVMRLPEDQIANAMGIASMQCAGIMEMVSGTGSDLRGMYAGFSAKGAVLAVLMAQKGVSGIKDLFEGRYGLFATYFDGRYDREKILAGLGHDYLGGGTLYKRWPAVGTAHSHMKAAIDIVEKYDLRPDDIAEIRVAVGDYHELMCQPLAVRREPTTLMDARFSLPFLVAIASVRRGMSVSDLSPSALRDPVILAAARKVIPMADPTLDWTHVLPPGRLAMVLHSGDMFEATGHNVPGGLDNPLGWSELAAKFAECTAVSLHPPEEEKVVATTSFCCKLETTNDATELLRLLT